MSIRIEMHLVSTNGPHSTTSIILESVLTTSGSFFGEILPLVGGRS